jgi:EAL domain-containing protein (putative c-di-GMP-specific phosphodiesterase class I)
VNVSARQFRAAGFLETVRAALAESRLPAHALQLELTESLLIGDEHYALRTLRALRDMGVSIAIDDFGTGYSSLSYLTRLPVDALKIDQSFVRNLSAHSEGTAIVRAIIAMAHSLKLKVIAEGVETGDQLEFLRSEGCDKIQGYLFARPLSQPDITAFIHHFGARPVEPASAEAAA